MVVFHVSTFILLLHLTGGYDSVSVYNYFEPIIELILFNSIYIKISHPSYFNS